MENVAAVATDEPQMAAKPPQAAMVATPRPPRLCPTKAFAARNISRLMPALETKAPISRNMGMMPKVYSVTVRIVVWPTIFNAVSKDVR